MDFHPYTRCPSGGSLPLMPPFPPFFCLPLCPFLREHKKSLPLPHKEQFPFLQRGGDCPHLGLGMGGRSTFGPTFLRAPSQDCSLPEESVSVVHVFLHLVTSTFLYFLLEREIKVKEIILSGTQVQKK